MLLSLLGLSCGVVVFCWGVLTFSGVGVMIDLCMFCSFLFLEGF